MEERENKKKNSFTVPEGYFGQLNRDILDATSEKRTDTTVVRKRYRLGRFSRFAGIAAAITIVFVLAGNLFTNSGTTAAVANANSTASAVYDDIDNEMIDNLLSNYPIDEYTFYCYLTDTEY